MDARIKSGMTNLDQRAGWFWTTSMDFTKRSTHPAICCLTGCLDYPTGKSVRVVIVACPAPFAKIFLFFRNENQAISPPIPSHRGAARDRHGRGTGCGGRGCAVRRTALRRTAEACGPDIAVLVSSSRNPTFANDGGKRAVHRGERVISRKPLRGECRVIPV